MTGPIFLKPALVDTIWGGTRLMTEYGFQTTKDNIAAAWMLSCHPDGESVVTGGEFDGMTLTRVVADHPEYVGSKYAGGTFPVLIKLIDAEKDLSIQVHPDDAYAAKNEPKDPRGKTEAWYVIDARRDAKLIYGFRNRYTKEQFREAIESKTLTQITNDVHVKPGNVVFIPSGTLHAICRGVFLAEVQQSCNTTYRVYDYDRLDDKGELRPLHIDKAVDVTKCEPPEGGVTPLGKPEALPFGSKTLLTECEYFSSSLYEINGEAELQAGPESFVSVIALNGSGSIKWQGETRQLDKGDSVFIPANADAFCLSGNLRLLVTTL